MFSFRYITRLIGAFISRFKFLIILGIALGIFVFFLISLVVPALTSGKTVKIGMTGRFTPTTLPVKITGMISDGLTKVSPSGDVEPALALSWETTDKGKTWTFKLANKTWQDGKPVEASDISYQFSDLTVEKPDKSTLVFKLENQYSAFPIVVSKPVFKKGLLGTGKWRVKSINLAGGYVTQLTLDSKEKERIIYKFYPTEERTKLAFKLGEISKMEDLLSPSPLDTWKNIEVEKTSNTGEYVVIFFNNQDKALGEKNLRQALSYAIDKNSFNGVRAISPISVDSWAYNPQVKPYDYDLEKAKNMVGELPGEVKNGLKIKLTTSPTLLPTAETIAKNWKDVGVDTEVEVVSSIPSEYQALLVIFDAPEDPDQYSLWHSTQTTTNISRYQNPRIDKLLEDGRTQLNLEERRKAYLDFQRFLLEDSPTIFLYYPYTYTITR